MELEQALRTAVGQLRDAGVPSPRADAELLAAHLLSVSRGRVLAMALAGAPTPEGYEELVARRAQRIPLQHLTGIAYFRHLELAVGPGVFIPRPETELLAQLAIDRARAVLAEQGSVRVVDLGTGSGAIAASVASEVPGSEVFAVELSDEAFPWAQRNTAPHGVTLLAEDLRTALAPQGGTFDIVVSNPPYIPPGAIPRDPEVRDHDPELALYGGGDDGLDLPRAVIATGARLLVSGGYLALEHAEVQAPSMLELFAQSGRWRDVIGHRDLNDADRVTAAYLAETAVPAGSTWKNGPRDRTL
ncbi:peptide chain release factor N(5)-glutamine methyltransferase [Arthrobacter rhombi]|uniref:peptide chain release factor N(5)-glutamine methyltransferase n=1 Tax=Micrococcaceae TaxID=1268 RepID=UPI000BB72AC5|nr:peptide chain release factor N(5)-glutamine methyltransferase [Glutamicibacter sp. BW78]PCC25652.1 protein-(glutamine-N5) methyltransferase, release factor-specific [Glutamicibacter sp. BW78]